MNFTFWTGFMGGLGIGLVFGVLSPVAWSLHRVYTTALKKTLKDIDERIIFKMSRRNALTLKRALRKIDRKAYDRAQIDLP